MADVLADGRATLADVILPTESAGIDVAPANIDLASTEGELFTALGREQVLRDALEGQVARLRLRPHRLPAEPRPADGQRTRRGEQRDHPGPDPVLRDEGPEQPRQGHQHDPDEAEPRPPDPRPAADVLRQPDEPRPRHARRAARRRRPPRLQQHRPQHREARRGAARRPADHVATPAAPTRREPTASLPGR